MSELLKSIKEHFKNRPDQAKLTETRHVNEFTPPEIKLVVSALYKEKDLNLRLFATVLNAIFTQHRAVFLFSRPILEQLLKKDPNVRRRKTINGDEFNSLMINVCGKYLERLAEPNKGEHRASVYKLVNSEILNYLKSSITSEVISEQEAQCLDLFNRFEKTSSNTSNETSSGDGVENGNDLTCRDQKQKETSKVDNPLSPPPRRSDEMGSVTNIQSNRFQPNPGTSEEVAFQRLIWATKEWAQQMTKEHGDYRQHLMGRKKRSKLISNYMDYISRNGCVGLDVEYTKTVFESVVIDSWLKKDSEQNRVLRQEVGDQILIATTIGSSCSGVITR